MTDLVVISLEAWDGIWRRNQHLITRLLEADRELRVLFVEPPADPIHDVRGRRAPRFGSGPRVRDEVSPRLWTLQATKLLPRRIDPRADERIAATVVRTAERLGMSAPVLWLNDPAAVDAMRRSGWPTLYDMTDDWVSADRPERERARIVAGERMLLESAAQVVACSPELLRRKAPVRASAGMPPIVLIRNAVDTAAYRRRPRRPADLPDGRIALYSGTLHSDRLDVALCERTAAAVSGHATVVLVGPDALREADSRRLGAAGVRLLGAKPHEQVPAYLMHADVLLVPHVVDDFTDSLDPIKLYEYEAAARPIVSTPVAGFRDATIPNLQVVPAREFASAVATVATTRDLSTGGFRAEAADWRDRASAMRTVIARTASTAPGTASDSNPI